MFFGVPEALVGSATVSCRTGFVEGDESTVAERQPAIRISPEMQKVRPAAKAKLFNIIGMILYGENGTRPEFILPMIASAFLRIQSDGLLLAIKLQPRASANEIGQPLGNELRIRVTAPPVDSAANEALLRFLAEKLNCPRGSVDLIRGHSSRHKVVKLYGLSAEEVLGKLSSSD